MHVHVGDRRSNKGPPDGGDDEENWMMRGSDGNMLFHPNGKEPNGPIALLQSASNAWFTPRNCSSGASDSGCHFLGDSEDD